MGADIVSIGEYRRARAAGMPPERILFSGVGKTADEMAEALAGGLLQFNLESVEEARILSAVALAAGTRAPVAFRINPDVEAGTHAKITTGTADNKFGIPAAEALDAFRAARDLPGLDVTGSHRPHRQPADQPRPARGGVRAAGHADRHAARRRLRPQIADLGGGLGVPYGPGQPDPPKPGRIWRDGRRASRATGASGWRSSRGG